MQLSKGLSVKPDLNQVVGRDKKQTAKRFCRWMVVIFFLMLIMVPAWAKDTYSGFIHNGSTMIPVRGVFQRMGATVEWLPETKEIAIEKDQLSIMLQVNNKTAVVNGIPHTLTVAPLIHEGTTYLPLRFVAEALGAKVDWDAGTNTASIVFEGTTIPVQVAPVAPPVSAAKVQSFKKKINGVNVTGVIIPANSGLKPKIALANGQIGTTQSLAEMAKAHNAVAAINGTFFSAYGGVPVPWNHLIKDGEVVHIGNYGSAFGFTKDGRVKLERLRIKIIGGTNDSFKYPNNWYAFGVNHWPAPDGNLAFIFTSAWGKTLGFSHGTNIVVSNGVVTKIGENQDVEIPANGYVISLHGSEKYLASRFDLETTVDYEASYTNDRGQEVDWTDVITAVGAGPSLVKDGEIIVDPAAEGFTEAKILSQSMARSAIGVNYQGDIILVHATATVQTLAKIMQELGAVQAMNLDGGASSGIYLNGSYLVQPGRELSNALIFVK